MAAKTNAKSKPDAKAPAKVTVTSTASDSTSSLYTWNKYLAVIFAAQGLLILILSKSQMFPITTSYLGTDTLQTQAQGHTVLATGAQHLFDINLAFVVAAFLFVAAIGHALAASSWRSRYESDVHQGVNAIRWGTYAASGGIMVLAIAMLLGVQDISTLLMLFGLTALASVLGFVMETHNRAAAKINWSSYAVGKLAWLVLAIYVVAGAVYGNVPAYVYWVFGSMTACATCYVIIMYLQYRRNGRWTNYVYGEKALMILSLVAQTLLAWQIFAGSLRP